MEKGEKIRTYLDDIKFQIVRENNKRTPFYNSDFQIVAKNKQAIREIEKNEKLVSTEYKRQMMALESRLLKLQTTKRELGVKETPPPRAQSFTHRRYSAPNTSTLFMASQEALVTRDRNSAASRDQVFDGLRKSDVGKEIAEPVTVKNFPSESFKETHHRKNSRHSHPDVKECQRLAEVLSGDNGDAVCKKFQTLAPSTRRRATIAEGPLFSGVLPSKTLIDKLAQFKTRSTSIEEET